MSLSPQTRAQFFEESRRLRETVASLVPRGVLDEVLSLLADYRAEHHLEAGN